MDGGVASREPDVGAGDQSGVEEDYDSIADEIKKEQRRIERIGVRYSVCSECPDGNQGRDERNENENEGDAGYQRKEHQLFILSEDEKGSSYKVDALGKSSHRLLEVCHALIYLPNLRDWLNEALVSRWACAVL